MNQQALGSTASATQGDDEIIPTAIVIKNIPFNVKRETLLDIIVRTLLSLPIRRWSLKGSAICHGLIL